MKKKQAAKEKFLPHFIIIILISIVGFLANLGKAYKEKGMIEEARESFEKALELNPNNKDAIDGLISLD